MNIINRTLSITKQTDKATLKQLSKIILAQTGYLFLTNSLHECAHALAALMLYENANPKIQISFFDRSFCRYNNATLNSWGKQVGPDHATSLVSSAGPIADILGMLAVMKLSKSDKKAAMIMASKALSTALYALSALVECDPAHDYCKIWSNSGLLAYGLLSAASLATSAWVLHTAFFRKNSEKEKEAAPPEKPRLRQTLDITSLIHPGRNRNHAALKESMFRRSF